MRLIISIVTLILLCSGCVTQVTDPGSNEPAATHNPRAAELNVQLGANYMAQGKLNLANRKLLRALEQNPRSASAHWTYAVLNERLGEYQVAETHFKKALSLNNKDSLAHNNYGAFLCNRDRLEEADKHFKKALSDPLYQYPEAANLNAGLCAMKVPDYDKAQSYFLEALRLNTRNRVALYQLSKIHFEQRKYGEAAEYMEKFEKNSKHNSQTLWLAFQVHNNLGDRTQARAYADQLRAGFPESEEAKKLANY
jgi:type IV pilus assembly protein PilF